MIHEDVIVYAAPGGKDYVANFTEDGWKRWPAVEAGWLLRQGCPATLADQCQELDTKHARLAILLSGVE